MKSHKEKLAKISKALKSKRELKYKEKIFLLDWLSMRLKEREKIKHTAFLCMIWYEEFEEGSIYKFKELQEEIEAGCLKYSLQNLPAFVSFIEKPGNYEAREKLLFRVKLRVISAHQKKLWYKRIFS